MKNSIKNNMKLGAILAVVGIGVGLLVLFLMVSIYQVNIDGKIADGRPDEAITVRIVFAMLSWLGVSAGALWMMVLYGFLTNARWAWFWGTMAATIQILAGFFPMIPPSSIGLPAPTVWVFLIASVLWFGMLLIGGIDWKILALAFVGGLAYVLTFIDGVGAISRFQTEAEGFISSMYGMSQMVNWWGAAAWAVFIAALVKGKAWALPLGIFAAGMSMFGGFPVGVTDIIVKGRFSMFLVAPILSTGILIYLLLPNTRKMLADWSSKTESRNIAAD
ncbi:MAG: hypothetical protein B6D39_12060 [Anaerolineae bacterium UTCFX2]|jgi:hypothetical protein|nr:hypothetical protein [Anaerolineae bacterium]MCZ7554271.1 hypothetical protein [Anaerolineales bacterium]OQY87940.1 MAG: hypothetical protein B6D39_12060 [Anaerolineae bacterium UTCFX2]